MRGRLRWLFRSAASAARYASGWLIAGLILAWFQGWWPFVEQDQSQSKEPAKTSVVEWLDYCSPFKALDGQRMLTFTVAGHSVIAAEAPEEEKEKGVFLAKHPKERTGLWLSDEDTRRVSVEIGDSKSEYTLLIPFGEDQCILVSGSLSAADLTASLFGTPYYPEAER